MSAPFFTYRPLSGWPGAPTARRRRAPFRAGQADTLNLLRRELAHLRARNVIVQLALRDEDLRRDGMPRAGAGPAHPGVVLSFDSRHGPLSYPCDTYDSWGANLRAIALALAALRAVDRYGVTRRAEQYRGWAALPPPGGGPRPLDRHGAVTLLRQWAGLELPAEQTPEDLRDAYRRAAFRLHPDRGGDPEEFRRLQEAKGVLGL